MEALLETV